MVNRAQALPQFLYTLSVSVCPREGREVIPGLPWGVPKAGPAYPCPRGQPPGPAPPCPAMPGAHPLPTPTPVPPLPSLQEKRKRQTEIENKRRQLEDDRRQLQHLKVRIPRDPQAASAPRSPRLGRAAP